MRLHDKLAQLAHYRPFVVAAIVLLSLILLFCVPGCSGGGDISIASQNKRDVTLASGFSSGIYRFDSSDHATILLFDGPIENPAQVCTIQLFWQPHAGKTPIDETATNATIHYIIFAGDKRDHVGIYSGAGFVYVKSKPGSDGMRASVWEANLRLTDRNQDFNDLLGPSILQGGFTAVRDDMGVERAMRRLNRQLREQLGYPRMVEATPTSTPRQSVTLAR